MGSSSSVPDCITEELLEEYIQLTYLNKSDILKLLKQFSVIISGEKCMDLHQRYPKDFIIDIFPQLKYNPFTDRLFKVFSSLRDDCFSFEDMLDLCSIMSDNCPEKVKAQWAFQIFDFNEDGLIDSEDIKMIMDRLTKGEGSNRAIEAEDQDHIVDIVCMSSGATMNPDHMLKAMDIQGNGSINRLEFEHAIGKMPEFPNSFSFRI